MSVIVISLILLVVYEYTIASGESVEWPIHSLGPIYFMMYIPLTLTVISGFEFLYKNRKAFYDLMRSMDSYDPADDI